MTIAIDDVLVAAFGDGSDNDVTLEDNTLTLANIALLVAPLGALLDSSSAIPRWQSFLTGVGLLAIAWANYRLGARKSAAAVLGGAALWFGIGVLRPVA